MRLLVAGIASSGGSRAIRTSNRSLAGCRRSVVGSASFLLNDGAASNARPPTTGAPTAMSAVATRHLPQPSLPLTVCSARDCFVPHIPSWSARRGFAAAAAAAPKTQNKKGSKDEAGEAAALGYLALKKARKERRRELHETSVQRRAKLATRRRDPNVDAESGGRHHRSDSKVAFRNWFVAQKVKDEYMNRKARQLGLDWKIQVSAMLIRNAVVLPDKEPWETEMENLQAHLGQFGKMYPKALIDMDYDAPIAITDEELMELLPEGYVPAPRVTQDDLSGNVRTTNRKLKTDVYLVVQQEDGGGGDGPDDGTWRLPTVSLREDETLLQAAQRAVAESVGPSVEHWSVSNAPLSVHMEAFSEDDRAKDPSLQVLYGTKTFFMKLYYDEGEASTQAGQSGVRDFAWLDRDEIVDRVKAQQGEEASTFYRYLL